MTEAGTVAALVLLLASVTTAPPTGAALAERHRAGAARAAGHGCRIHGHAADAGGFTVSVAVLAAPL